MLPLNLATANAAGSGALAALRPAVDRVCLLVSTDSKACMTLQYLSRVHDYQL